VKLFNQGVAQAENARLLPAPPNQSQVLLAESAGLNLTMQVEQTCSFCCQKEQSRGLAVESVHKIEACPPLTRGTESFNETERDAAASMNGKTDGLVYGKNAIGLIDALNSINQGKGGALHFLSVQVLWLRNSYRRQSQPLTRCQSLLGPCSGPVKPNLTRSKHSIDTGLGHTLEVPKQKIIDSLAFVLSLDLEPI
jgi:hypothetical protein